MVLAYKHDYDTKLFRRTQIIAKLYNGAKLTHKELADEFNVSTKTIQRDFSSLVALYPIYKDGHSWRMQEDYEFEEQLSIQDDFTLKLLLEASKNFDKNFQERSSKLLSRISENISSPIYAKIELESISHKLSEVHLIEEAINTSKQISFNYLVEDYFETTIDPYKIVNFESFWYLVGKRNGKLRRYYLQNVFDVEIEDVGFRKSKKMQDLISNAINIWFDESESFEVKLLIDKSIKKYFQRKPISKSQRYMGEDEDNNMIITLQATHENEIYPIVKYWLPNIKILEPKEMQTKVEEDVRRFLSGHEDV